MAQADWTDAVGSLTTSQVRRGASNGFDPPSGAGIGTYVMNSVTNDQGAVVMYYNGTGYSPTPANKGMLISGAVKRAVSGGLTDYAGFLCAMMQGNNVGDEAYILGQSDAEPSHIVLRKGTLTSGLPDVAPGSNGVLARSTITFNQNTWLHLKLECVANVGSDTIINCRINYGSVDSPTWEEIPGIDRFYDDLAGIASGSPGFNNGRVGFGGWFNDSSRRVYFDYIRITAQP
jgi:hypothetical protein